jgi:hypothetical protein
VTAAWKLVLSLCAASALCAAAAFAGTMNVVEYESAVKLREAYPAFHGKVTGENAACAYPRRVKLYEKRRTGGRRLLGVDRTDAEGRWRVIVEPLESGVYFAVVKRREEGAAGTFYVCLRDRSKTAVVD